MITASYTSWQIGMIIDGMFAGEKSKWPQFNEWLNNLGLGSGKTQQGKRSRKETQYEVAADAARIRAKFAPIAKDILKQRAQGKV